MIMLLVVLLGCAGNKPVVEQTANYDRECDALFARIGDYQNNPERFPDFETFYELSKKQFPLDLGDGMIFHCLKTITCNGINYCVIVEADGHWSYTL